MHHTTILGSRRAGLALERGRRAPTIPKIHVTPAAPRSYIATMRVFLALLAVVGMLLSPVAASAATPACLHHHDAMDMVVAMDASGAPTAGDAMPCCDDDGGKPTQHDSKSCAQACAAICGVTAALPQMAADLPLAESHARVEPAAPSPLHAHGPPALKRPPKHHA